MYATLWREDVDRRIASDPEFARNLHDILTDLNDPTAPPHAFVDVVSQPWARPRRDWYDAAAFLEVSLHLQLGWCVAATMDVGATPLPDADTDGNNAILKQLPAPFTATFHGGPGDNDGYVAWDQPQDISHDMGGGDRITARFARSMIPLEVGRTEPETTLQHLAVDGGVARWPYGRTHIVLLLATVQLSNRRYPTPLPTIVDGTRRVPPPALGEGPRRGGQ